VAQRLASDRVLPLATDLILQFSRPPRRYGEAIAALELLADQVARRSAGGRGKTNGQSVGR